MTGFSSWRPLTAFAEAPQGPGVFQIKVVDHLIDYPRGRSAMVFYGSAVEVRAALAAVAQSMTTRFSSLGPLVWRALATDRHAEELARHLQRFVEQFQSPPAGNQPAGSSAP